jgi:hypothetical protein
VAALLSKPLLDLWVLENSYAQGGYDRDGDDDAWSVALALSLSIADFVLRQSPDRCIVAINHR